MQTNYTNAKLVLISKKRFKGNWTPLSALIKLSTNCKYHHCAIIHNGHVIEADSKGVRVSKTEHEFRSRIGIDYDVLEKDVFAKGIEIKLIYCIGKKYDFLSLFYHLFNQIGWGYIGRNNTSKMTCGTFCAYVLGLPNYWKTDPQDLYRDYFR